MCFLGLSLSDRVPDARTIWFFREMLIKAGVISSLFDQFDAHLRASGYIAMSGQIVDASLVSAPKQRNSDDEKRELREGGVPESWKAKPAKLRHKDQDARWTVKFTKAKERSDGTKLPVDIAIPSFGYQNHISIDRGFGFIRKWMVTDAGAYEGARLREGLLDKTNTASSVWADTAYRSAANENSWQRTASGVVFIVKSRRGNPYPKEPAEPIMPSRKSGHASSMFLPKRKPVWDYLFEQSALPAPLSRTVW